MNTVANRAAILVRKGIKVANVLALTTSVSLKIDGTCIVSVYSSPNEENVEHLQEVATHMTKSNAPLVITGDFNTRWRPFTNLPIRPRDIEFQDFVLTNDLKVDNDGTSTCTHQGRLSTNDYTMTKNNSEVTNWEVKEEDSLSDHRYIMFNVNCSKNGRETKKEIGHRKVKESATGPTRPARVHKP